MVAALIRHTLTYETFVIRTYITRTYITRAYITRAYITCASRAVTKGSGPTEQVPLSRRYLDTPVRKLYIAGAILLSVGAFYLSTGLREFWPLAWIAALPVLFVAFRSSARLAFGIAFTAFLLGSSNMFSYLWMLMPPVAVAVSGILLALAFAVAVLAARLAVPNT